jgi:hypothetical protein
MMTAVLRGLLMILAILVVAGVVVLVIWDLGPGSPLVVQLATPSLTPSGTWTGPTYAPVPSFTFGTPTPTPYATPACSSWPPPAGSSPCAGVYLTTPLPTAEIPPPSLYPLTTATPSP